MAIDGPLKSVLVVTEDELRVNGGRYLLQSGPAIKVRGYTEDTVGSRRIIHGDAQPVYVLGENDVRANGGRWLLRSGQPLRVTDVIGTARGVIQGKAIPVWPVDDDGNYDADFAGVAFLPTDISDLEFWVAANLGLSLNNGDPVPTWPDQSGNGRDATQGVGAARPTFITNAVNGQPVIRFDGVDDRMGTGAFALVQPEHIFLVIKMNADVVNDTVYDGVAGNRMRMYRTGAPANRHVIFAGAANVGTIDLDLVAYHYITNLYNGAASSARLDGVAAGAGNPGANNGGGVTLGGVGGAQTAAMDMAEFMVYSRALTDAERGQIETYLADKYGL